MKILVITEHDNKSLKQTSLSTLTAASQISDNVETVVLGSGIESVVNELKNLMY